MHTDFTERVEIQQRILEEPSVQTRERPCL